MIGRLLCFVGHHDWSCRMSRKCRGIGDHYCLRCFYGFDKWLAARPEVGQ